MKPTYDSNTLTVDLPIKGKNLQIDLNGVPSKIFTLLALHGAVSLCKTKKNPQQAWEEIKKGNLTGRPLKSIHPDIIILSQVLSISTDDARVLWASKDKKTKRSLRKSNFWKKARSDLLIDNDDEKVLALLKEL